MVAREGISKGQYVCEYRTYRVYPVGSEEARLAQESMKRAVMSSQLHTLYQGQVLACLLMQRGVTETSAAS